MVRYQNIFTDYDTQNEEVRKIQQLLFSNISKDNFAFLLMPKMEGLPQKAAMYIPVYESFLSLESYEDREKEIVAIAFYYLNITSFFEAKDSLDPLISFTTRISSSTSEGFPQVYISENPSYIPLARHTVKIKVENNVWIISAYSKNALDVSHPVKSFSIFLIGGIASMMMIVMTLIVTTARDRAIKMANRMMVSLKKSEKDFRNAFDSTNLGLVIVKLDFTCGKSNLAFQKISGYSQDEVYGISFNDISPVLKNNEKKIKEALVGKRDSLQGLGTLSKKDGKKINIRYSGSAVRDAKGSIIYFVINVEDITEELETQIKIERSEKRLKLTLDASQIGIWDWDPSTDTSHWDNTIYDFIGIDNRNISSKSLKYLLKIITPDYRDIVKNEIETSLAKKSGFNIGFNISRLDNKEIRRLHIVGHPVPSSNDLGIEYVGVCSDRTAEHKLDQLKSNFVSVASHQLRTPLTAIRWFREMILDNTDKEPLTEKQSRHLIKIEESSSRMLDLVDDLLQVSRLDNESVELKPIKYDIKDATEKIIDQVVVKLKEKKQKLDVTCNIKDTEVYADRTLTEQVMQNLITNALKYSPQKANIKIKITGLKSHIKWEIKDNGIGIAEEDKSKMFQQFFRSKEASESKADGSGLGLYIAKSIIELSGGELDFSSVHKKGSIFWFTLPKK